MKNRAGFLGFIVVTFIVVAFMIAYLRIQQAGAQEDLIASLNSRLEEAGVKVVSIILKDDSYSFPEVTIQRLSDKDKLSASDILLLHLAERELIYSFQHGHPLIGYTLISIDPNGDQASWEQASANSDYVAQKINPFISLTADDRITKEHLENNLNLMGLNLDQIEVKTGVGSSKDVQIAEVYLSSNDLDIVNNVSRKFIESLRPLINELNQESGVRIAVLFVHLQDDSGNPLLEYLWDVQLDIVRSGKSEEIIPWYPEPPAPEEGTTPPLPIPTQTTDPLPPTNPITYPPPSDTPYP